VNSRKHVAEFEPGAGTTAAELGVTRTDGALLLMAQHPLEMDWLRALATDLGRTFQVVNGWTAPPWAVHADDLVILVLCPMGMGPQLVGAIRQQQPQVTICALSHSGSSEDAAVVLAAGADLWLPTSMDRRLIMAFVEAQLRRKARASIGSENPVAFDREHGTLRVGQQIVSLRAAEFRVCEYLAAHAHRWVAAVELRQHALGIGAFSSDSLVRVHVSNLRKALGPRQDWIQSRRRLGYRFLPRAELLQ
jgi:DNA-binding response OmpR family regulator